MNQLTEFYVAYASCGHLVFSAVDEPAYAKENGREVSKCIKAGYRVARLTLEEMRAAEWCGPKCSRWQEKHKGKQAQLDLK